MFYSVEEPRFSPAQRTTFETDRLSPLGVVGIRITVEIQATDIDSDMDPTRTAPLMELASMFEGPFSLDWLVELTDLKVSTILSVLENQVQAGTLTTIKPAIYEFDEQQRKLWRARISPDRKKRFHSHIASILIRELTEDETKPIKISGHLLKTDVDANGCRWLMKAGRFYARAYRAKEAIACFYHILTQLSEQYGEEEDLLFIKAAMAHDNHFAGRTDLALFRGFMENAWRRAKNRNWEAYGIVLEMHIARYDRLSSAFNQAFTRFNRAYARARSIRDPDLRSVVSVTQSYFLFWQGRFQETITYFEKTVPDVHKAPFGFFPLLASVMVGHCYTLTGQVSQGLGMLDDLRDLSLKKDDRYLLSHVTSTIAMVLLSINRLDDAIYYLKLALKEANESKNIWAGSLATIMIASAFHRKGLSKKALFYLRKFSTYGPAIKRSNLLLFPYLVEICWAMENGELKPLNGFSLTDEIDYLLGLNNYFMKGLAYRYKALQNAGRNRSVSEVIRAFSLSEKWLKKSGNRIELAQTYLFMIRYYLGKGNRPKALSTLNNAADILVANEYNLIPDDLRPLIKSNDRQETLLSEILKTADHMDSRDGNNRFLQDIIATTNRITGAERGALLLLDAGEKPSGLSLRASKNITMEQISSPFFAPSMDCIQESIRTGEGRIFQADQSGGNTAGPEAAIRSCICVPLILEKKTIGVLYHDNRVLENVFSEFDGKLLKYLAAVVVLDLDRENKRRQLEQSAKQSGPDKGYGSGSDITIRPTGGMVGKSAAFKRTLSQVNRIADSNIAVLITGETGVGKNVLAKAIHDLSPRKDGPFVTVQCSALTEGLITSELFGHEKGAFTGAVSKRIGRFELANEGTLFLDEIGDLTLEVQSRLLRVLQSKEFERVGGGKDILKSDFRLIAATNKDLESEIKAKRFRKDLFFRISVFPIHIPPLRERKEDIPLLIEHFTKSFDPKLKRRNSKLSLEAIKRLLAHGWPGNIRELENVVQRELINGNETGAILRKDAPAPATPSNASGFLSLDENERRHIIATLSHTRGKVHGPGGAAELLKINPSTLTSRIKKMGIDKKSYQRK